MDLLTGCDNEDCLVLFCAGFHRWGVDSVSFSRREGCHNCGEGSMGVRDDLYYARSGKFANCALLDGIDMTIMTS